MNKEKMWKTIAIIACSLLIIIVTTSFSATRTSQNYDVCAELEDLEFRIDELSSNLSSVARNLSSIDDTLMRIYRAM